jgi:hypothetical protein
MLEAPTMQHMRGGTMPAHKPRKRNKPRPCYNSRYRQPLLGAFASG